MSNMAIKYAMMKKKKMANGGETKDNAMGKLGAWIDQKVGNPEPKAPPKPTGQNTRGAELLAKGYHGMADGGMVDGDHQSECTEHCNSPCDVHEMASGYMKHEGDDVKHNAGAESEDDDMIARIMSKRNMYSKGGRIANGGEDKLDHMADSKPNEFDDLALRDHLEESETGENSGDHLGDKALDEDEHDLVARIMRSRAKKDRLPNPR